MAQLEKKDGVVLLVVAAWNVVTFGRFAKTLAAARSRGEQRPAGYWVAHSVLIVVNVAIAGVLGRLGTKVLRGGRLRS